MSLAEIKEPTKNFDSDKVIGYENMGLMYEAVLPTGCSVAIKRLHKFENFEKQFLSELLVLGRLRHTNLGPLQGFCFEMTKEFLVYKYMPNGNLHDWLHSMPEVQSKNLGWLLRHKIAVGIARGLAWLHHNNVFQVAHLHLSSKCILLDKNFEPKLWNFGNAKILANPSGSAPSILVNSKVPDSGSFREDVYSFGIVLLELVTSKEPSQWTNTSSDRLYGSSSSVFKGFDQGLMGQGFDEELYETLRIAENCIQPSSDQAPTMLQVYKAIREIGEINSDVEITENEISDVCMYVENNGIDL